ncbi:hypothetical protein KP509_10G006100 [Ceratopteris richardii]|uniref:Uncharacterized protein n=1 Tax=Ceratopteris richardii TaxID=49495 RepID=A0A8T2U1N9_CERRI|nr:hypothetical protein KP509_10G006100 [Ceratopteris richardii]
MCSLNLSLSLNEWRCLTQQRCSLSSSKTWWQQLECFNEELAMNNNYGWCAQIRVLKAFSVLNPSPMTCIHAAESSQLQFLSQQ